MESSRKDLPDHVARHLEGRGIEPESLPDDVYETIASLTQEEVEVLSRVRGMLEDTSADTRIKVCMV